MNSFMPNSSFFERGWQFTTGRENMYEVVFSRKVFILTYTGTSKRKIQT